MDYTWRMEVLHALLMDVRFKPGSDWNVLFYLLWRADEKRMSSPGIQALVRCTGLSDDTVRRSLAKLEQHGYLQNMSRMQSDSKPKHVFKIAPIDGIRPPQEFDRVMGVGE